MHKHKKVLILCDWYLPGYKAGGPIQSCKNIVDTLHDEYEFYILTSDRDMGDAQAYENIATDSWVSGVRGVKIWYASPGWMNGSRMRKLIKSISPSVVYLNSMFSSRYSLLPLMILKGIGYKGRTIIAPRGMLQDGAMLQKALKKKMFLKLMALSGMVKNVWFHATDDQEVLDIKKYFKKNKGVVLAGNIPNTDISPLKSRDKKAGEISCVFVSRIHPKKNLHYALDLLKEVKVRGNVVFDVYGTADDAIYTEQCRKMGEHFSDNIKFSFKGALQHDELFSVLHDYHLFILPTLGENFGHAIFESMSAGCPVLISDQTPWNNIEDKNAGWSIPLNKKAMFVDKIEEVARMDSEAFNKMSLDARKYTEEYVGALNFSQIYSQLFG